MAYFNNRAEDWERLDWQILRDGGISLYWRAEYLAEDAQWLSNHDYNLYDFDCATWVSREDMFSDFGRALHFPEWWGRNFDALDDCITELELPESPGAAIVRDISMFTPLIPKRERCQVGKQKLLLFWTSLQARPDFTC